MQLTLLVISERKEDLDFGRIVAQRNGFGFATAADKDSVKAELAKHPDAVVFWDTDHAHAGTAGHPSSLRAVSENFGYFAPPPRVFAISDLSINQNPNLLRHPVFGHHVFRRYDEPAPTVVGKLVQAVLEDHSFGIARYFPPNSQNAKVVLKHSNQKSTAVQAVQNYLVKLGIKGRISALVAKAADELIMNALFDAPTLADGTPKRRDTPRDSTFALDERDQITLEVMSTQGYAGISVTDQFGSLRKDLVLQFLRQDYKQKQYHMRKMDHGAGLGLHGITQSGISLLLHSEPGAKTEVILFFPITDNYRKFREGFRFLTILSD